ncbi:hypothetical protein Glove_54g30 [Diversispora epigaea]|uniref:Restriction endonuclease type IV Mrr domain-containing protein n=1 Tax=Diversispora epigaea TaxID=1348612 RepID=A0A397JCQ6_9GLOM|nr:hypothetical protein Glove_54g30 [Diversispora epigaea]
MSSSNNNNTISPYKKGKDFEDVIKEVLKNMNVELRKPEHAPGDGGIDFMGGWREHTIIVQCKDHVKIRPETVRGFEGVLSRYGRTETIGVLVAPSINNFTLNAVDRVKSSEFNIILTDKSNMEPDLIRFIENRHVKSAQQIENISNELVNLRNDLIELNRKIESTNKNNRFYFISASPVAGIGIGQSLSYFDIV